MKEVILTPLAFAHHAERVRREWEGVGFHVHIQTNAQRITISVPKKAAA